eukprot:scaffold3208_cov402-Prasinococcus_capsulatus_cf.AAC.4
MIQAELQGRTPIIGSSNDRQAFYANRLRRELRRLSSAFDRQAEAATVIQFAYRAYRASRVKGKKRRQNEQEIYRPRRSVSSQFLENLRQEGKIETTAMLHEMNAILDLQRGLQATAQQRRHTWVRATVGQAREQPYTPVMLRGPFPACVVTIDCPNGSNLRALWSPPPPPPLPPGVAVAVAHTSSFVREPLARPPPPSALPPMRSAAACTPQRGLSRPTAPRRGARHPRHRPRTARPEVPAAGVWGEGGQRRGQASSPSQGRPHASRARIAGPPAGHGEGSARARRRRPGWRRTRARAGARERAGGCGSGWRRPLANFEAAPAAPSPAPQTPQSPPFLAPDGPRWGAWGPFFPVNVSGRLGAVRSLSSAEGRCPSLTPASTGVTLASNHWCTSFASERAGPRLPSQGCDRSAWLGGALDKSEPKGPSLRIGFRSPSGWR